MFQTNSTLRINHYTRSLKDYETKIKTAYPQLSRYDDPLLLFWRKDKNEVVDLSAVPYACRVKAMIKQMEELVEEGLVPLSSVSRPEAIRVSWHEEDIQKEWESVEEG